MNECHEIDTSSRARKTEHMKSRQNVPRRFKMVSKPWNRRLSTWPHFQSEGFWNSEVAYWHKFKMFLGIPAVMCS